jgi:hypothetical protein
MSKQTLTGELRKSLAKLKVKPYHCYSDPRKNKTAVGVKLVGEDLTQEKIDLIVYDMENKGYEFIKTTPNRRFNILSGTRLTFYKKEHSFLSKK